MEESSSAGNSSSISSRSISSSSTSSSSSSISISSRSSTEAVAVTAVEVFVFSGAGGVSRLHCESESFKMDLILDINSWLYPMELDGTCDSATNFYFPCRMRFRESVMSASTMNAKRNVCQEQLPAALHLEVPERERDEQRGQRLRVHLDSSL
ncbi:hypothetical protein HZH68_011643 [Vespula germanica]|uniref:Uncharacterized protein n=1 Tax=Vespula germanica TaxID=30212 RepID=A0A834JLN6_VESGE|nr:hypothetical protein HZH68_011643 [Vespula germanica]